MNFLLANLQMKHFALKKICKIFSSISNNENCDTRYLVYTSSYKRHHDSEISCMYNTVKSRYLILDSKNIENRK